MAESPLSHRAQLDDIADFLTGSALGMTPMPDLGSHENLSPAPPPRTGQLR